MNRSAPSPRSATTPWWRSSPWRWPWSGAGVRPGDPASATPALTFRPSPLTTELATLPAETSVWFDPRLGVVTESNRPYQEITGERLPVVDGEDLRQFLNDDRARRRSRLWTATIAERLSGREREAEGLIPELENPQGPGAARAGIRRGVGLRRRRKAPSQRGRLTRDAEPRSAIGAAATGRGRPDLDLDEILDLRILGTWGTKLDVAVDFNSTRELESKQLITATYTGTEDEIVKKVEAGDIG